jgi:cell division protein FtsL
MLTLGVCVLVAITLISRYVHIYDLNLQAQKLDKDIATAKKQISTYEMEKQNLEQKVAQKAKDLGYVAPDENATIFIPANPISTEGDN